MNDLTPRTTTSSTPVHTSRWTLPLGTYFGIGVRVHGTLLVLFGALALIRLATTGSLLAAIGPVATFAAVLFFVLLHEYGHALVARRFGIGTRSITLLPIGGVAQLDRNPDEPREELLVALAGPAVNLVLAALLFSLATIAGALVPAFATSPVAGVISFLTAINVVLFVFNMLPAFPMDGGRVLRAILSARVGLARATVIAASVGRALAVGFGVVGLFINPFLVLIAVFVWIGAGQEARFAVARSRLSGALVGNAMTTDFVALAPTDDLQSVADLSLRTAQQHYPVVSEGAVVGVLLQDDLSRALAGTPAARVGDVMRRDVEIARVSDALESAFMRLFSSSLAALPVLEGRVLVGLITRDSIRQFLALRRMRRKPAMG